MDQTLYGNEESRGAVIHKQSAMKVIFIALTLVLRLCSRAKGSSAPSSLETALKDLRELMKMESKLTKSSDHRLNLRSVSPTKAKNKSDHRADNQILEEKTLEKS